MNARRNGKLIRATAIENPIRSLSAITDAANVSRFMHMTPIESGTALSLRLRTAIIALIFAATKAHINRVVKIVVLHSNQPLLEAVVKYPDKNIIILNRQ